MSNQPVSIGNQFTNVGTIGTTVLSPFPTTIHRIIIPGTYVGSINIHNSATAAGTSGTSSIYTLGLPATGIPQSIEIGIRLRSGLTIEATGTPTATLVWGE